MAPRRIPEFEDKQVKDSDGKLSTIKGFKGFKLQHYAVLLANVSPGQSSNLGGLVELSLKTKLAPFLLENVYGSARQTDNTRSHLAHWGHELFEQLTALSFNWTSHVSGGIMTKEMI